MKTLYYGGSILTMEDSLYADAVLVENGTIQALGSRDDLRRFAGDCREVDLKGAAMLPGFIDPHSHIFQVAVSFLRVDLDGVSDPEEMGRRVKAFVQKNRIAPGELVSARDYDNNIMPDLKNPTLAQLDAISPDNPLIIHHKSGHMGLLNSAALALAGITDDTPSPEGGRIEKQDGKLTGYLEENAFFDVIQRLPMMDPRQLLNSFADAQKQYASFGITTVQDGMVADPMLGIYGQLMEQDLLYLDVYLYSGIDTYDKTQALLARHPENRHLHSGGLKIFLDGSPQGRTAWMRTPYAGQPDYTGYGTMTDEAVENAFRLAVEKNTQIIAHCNGDGASAQFLRCLQKVEQELPRLKELRPVIIHGQLLGVDQLPLVKKLGAMVSFFAAHVYHWGDVHIRNFGPERAAGISPARSAMEAGIPVTFHQDAPVIRPDMLETLWCATNRITKNGVPLGQEERISTLDALKAVTVNAAWQYSLEDRIGSIAPGKAADFVILDRDPLEVPASELRSLRVLATIKAGEPVYQR